MAEPDGKGRRTAAALGAAALALLIALGLSWKEIALRWHVDRLRRDPRLLLESSWREGIRAEAARLFARIPSGKREVARLFVVEALAELPADRVGVLADGPLWALRYREDRLFFQSSRASSSRKLRGSTWGALAAILAESGGGRPCVFDIPEHRDIRFVALDENGSAKVRWLAESRGQPYGGILALRMEPGRALPDRPCLLPLLVDLLRCDDPEMAASATSRLEAAGVDAADPAPGLIAILRDPEWRNCEGGRGRCFFSGIAETCAMSHPAAKALAALGPDALPPLAEALKEGTWSLRGAQEALKLIGSHPGRAVPILRDLAASPDRAILVDVPGPPDGRALSKLVEEALREIAAGG